MATGITIWIVVGIFAGICMRLLMPRSGVGNWIGDITLGVIGAGFGAYIIDSYAMGHTIANYSMVLASNAAMVAFTFLLLIHGLSRRMPNAPDADQDDLASDE